MWKKMRDLKVMFESGHIQMRSAVIVPCMTARQGSWQLCFGNDPENIAFTLRAFRGDVSREFRSIDAAFKAAQEIGYERVSVFYPK